ncbi:hypothetical protein GGF31_007161 [Allomyces arbusculus]|nr:hypothetical protein GGF31_007161 [Allomyces arbusculus]
MKSAIATTLLLAVVLLATAAPAVVDAIPSTTTKCPNGVIYRKEFRDLTEQEWDDFVAAMLGLAKKPSTRYPGLNKLEEYASIHSKNFNTIHNNAIFMPWHRKFLIEWEKDLRTVKPNVAIPYWAEHLDFNQPEKSVLFDADFMGGSNPDKNLKAQCIKTGPFASYTHQEFGCISRGFGSDGRIAQSSADGLDGRFHSGNKIRFPSGPEVQTLIDNNKDWESYRSMIEYTIHPIAHLFVGSDSGTMEMTWSSQDPIFALHHAYIDKIYAAWQKSYGTNDAAYQAIQKSNLPVYNVPVSSVDSLEANCIQYLEPGALNPIPATSTSTTATATTSKGTSSTATTATTTGKVTSSATTTAATNGTTSATATTTSAANSTAVATSAATVPSGNSTRNASSIATASTNATSIATSSTNATSIATASTNATSIATSSTAQTSLSTTSSVASNATATSTSGTIKPTSTAGATSTKAGATSKATATATRTKGATTTAKPAPTATWPPYWFPVFGHHGWDLPPRRRGYPLPPVEFPGYFLPPLPPVDRYIPQMPRKFAEMMGYNLTVVREYEKKYATIVEIVEVRVKQGVYVPSFGMSDETKDLMTTLHQETIETQDQIVNADQVTAETPAPSAAATTRASWTVAALVAAAIALFN